MEFAPGWPTEVQELYARIFAFDPEAVEGKARLGEEFAFSEAPEAIGLIHAILRDLAEEPWSELPGTVTGALAKQLSQLAADLDKMQAFSPGEQSNPKQQRDQLAQKLGQRTEWLRDNVRHHARKAEARRVVEEQLSGIEGLGKWAKDTRATLEGVGRELESYRGLVKGLRQVTGEEAGQDLARFFNARAEARGNLAKAWAWALLGAGGLTILAALIVYWQLKPNEGATDAAAFTRLALAAVIIGLFLFAVRVCAQQHRVNRHLEAVAQTKAAALLTFTPLSAAIEEKEIRSAVAAALAQSVFETENTGLVDGSSDQVTIVERALSAPRIARSGPGDASS